MNIEPATNECLRHWGDDAWNASKNEPSKEKKPVAARACSGRVANQNHSKSRTDDRTHDLNDPRSTNPPLTGNCWSVADRATVALLPGNTVIVSTESN